jgi:raffinose/stachyose/melibiose transport system substrate-binding protein
VSTSRRRITTLAATSIAALSLTLTGCAVGNIGGDSGSGGGQTEITFLTQDGGTGPAFGEALIKKFTEANPDIKVTLDVQPGGTEGDNLVKTKLATGEMADVFTYNSGSLFQAINPDQNLVPLTDEPWAATLSEDFKKVVSTDNGLYGAPTNSTQAGGVFYNLKVYERLGLKVPTTWAEFMSNNEKIKADGKVDPIQQTYGDTWTAQLFVLGDYANVSAQDPEFAEQYTLNKRTYSQQPALQGFLNQQAVAEKNGWFNKNFASATFEDGIQAVATGKAAHYPMLSGSISTVIQNAKENVNDIGMFALPAPSAEDTRLSIWLPNAAYIPKTTEGAELEAAKKFITFINSPEGCELQATVNAVSGPFATTNCKTPTDVPVVVKDIERYITEKKSGPALEFLSPIKGPNLSQITVEVGSKIKSGEAGAKLYDEDVKKQAQQLGLPGW